MRIGILGSGLMGGKLGTMFARAGHDVVFSYSHSREKLEKLAKEAGKKARAGTPQEAVRSADAVLLAVHWTRVDDVLEKAGALSGKVLVTCSLPMSADDSHLVVGRRKSGSEAVAAKVPRAHVISAFSTAPNEVLFSVFKRRHRAKPPNLVYCGDNKRAKSVAARLIRDVGFNPTDIGGLDAARYIEPFSLLLAEIAYSGNHPELTYRLERLST
jgi:predicted dinucleotide-binding enzyme